MSRFEFRLPDIGEGVAEGEVVEWHVRAGDRIAEDQPLVDVMTDKATVQIGAPKTGTVAELCVAAGTVAKVGEVLVVIDTPAGISLPAAALPAPTGEAPKVRKSLGGSNGAAASGAAADSSEATKTVASAVGDIRDDLPGAAFFAATSAPAERVGGHSGNPLATPSTRRLARSLGVDLHHVPGSGPEGRVTRQDLQRFDPGVAGPGVGAEVSRAQERRVPWIGLRRTIAERLQHSKAAAVHCTYVDECDVSRLVELRDAMRGDAEERGVRLTFLPFIARAVVLALKEHPLLNSRLDLAQGELVVLPHVHLGIATSTEDGLMVPVVRDADRLRLFAMASEIERLALGSRQRSLKPSELCGSTFTITSLGNRGGLLATPILNHPEVGIVGVHCIKRRPVVRAEQIVIADVMLMSLSFDHQVVDGDVAASFVRHVVASLEQPHRLFRDAF